MVTLASVPQALHWLPRELADNLDALLVGKSKLVLRSVSDRLEQTAICAVLAITRMEMEAHRLWRVSHLERAARRGDVVVCTRDNNDLPLSMDHVEALKQGVLADARVKRGREVIHAFGDLDALGDPAPYMSNIGLYIDAACDTEEARTNVHAVVDA